MKNFILVRTKGARATWMIWTAILTGVTSMSAPAQAERCPILAGRFHCPAHLNEPAYDMVVSQSGRPRSAVMYMQRASNGVMSTFFASTRGTRNPDGLFGVCRNKGVYLTRRLNDLSESFRTEVNAMGNYIVTTFMGEPVMTCLRVQGRK